jgi:hypothetical protein
MHYSFTINGLEGVIGMEVDAPATIKMKGGDKSQKKREFPCKIKGSTAQEKTQCAFSGQIRLCLGACVSI